MSQEVALSHTQDETKTDNVSPFRKIIGALVVALLLTAVASVVPKDSKADSVFSAAGLSPYPAAASAYGVSYFGSFLIDGIPIYNGNYGVTINGSGQYVRTVQGSFAAVGNVCNWHVTAEFFDANGRWYQTVRSPTKWGCDRSNGFRLPIYSYKHKGFMCSTLKSKGTRITSVCHSIF